LLGLDHHDHHHSDKPPEQKTDKPPEQQKPEMVEPKKNEKEPWLDRREISEGTRDCSDFQAKNV
jgi:hypothetical protein